MPVTITDDHLEGLPPITRGNPFSHAQSVTALLRRGLSTIETHDRGGRLYASQAAVCPRQATLSSTRQDQEVTTPASASYYALGNAIEELILGALRREGALLYPQYRLPDVDLNLGGYVDGIVLVGGRVHVLEVKSCGELPSEPKLEHRAQAMVYAAITGLPPIVFYFSRTVAGYGGDLKTREFALSPSSDELRATLYQVAYAREAIDAGVIPEIPTHFASDKDCGYCPWKSHCWSGEPLPRPVVSPEQHVDLVARASARVAGLMDPEHVTRRRNGVLRHIARHGTDEAREALAGDWSTLLGGPD